ncbi:MAG: EpsG family protein [Muribaculaceae bacterium]|nr:EpsG family protein [Muribaculaceae bacterium]
MLLSLVVYILLALTLFALGWHARKRDNARQAVGLPLLPFYCWEFLASIGVIAVVFGVRLETGSDHIMYLSQYFNMCKHGTMVREGGMESGFELITRCIASLKCHFTIYFGFWAFLQATLLYWGLRTRKFVLPWLGLLLILGPYSINWFSFLRQWVVTFGCVAMVPWVAKRKFWPYAVGVVLLSTIHYSAFLLIPVFFLPFARISSWSRTRLLVIYAVCIILGLYPIWIKAFSWIIDLLPIVGYDRYSAMAANLFSGEFRTPSFGPLRLITIFAQVVAIWYYPKVKSHRQSDNLLPVFFAFALLASCFECLFINTAHYMVRPADLFYVCLMIVVAYVADYLFDQKRYVELAICVIPILLFVPINVVRSYYFPGDMSIVVNYHFFFWR